jgi:GNAT superfamily N-acetyltransferase
MRMNQRPRESAPNLPSKFQIVRAEAPTVAFYRYLYNTVGADYVWWLRRTVPDLQLARILSSPAVAIYVLYQDGEPAGFYELDSGRWPSVNLGYFGMLPHAVGRGMGHAFLRHAVDFVWRARPQAMTVNTCTADHPRALPGYKRVGFRVFREEFERWDIPKSLGLTIPDRLILR